MVTDLSNIRWDSDSAARAERKALKKETVLVVEDHLDTRELFALMLAHEGCEVRQGENGNEALALLDQAQPDVLLVDLMMPEMDGIELIRRVRQMPEFGSLPIVATTALTGAIIELAALAGATVAMMKPFEPGQVVGAVRDAMQKQKVQA